MLHSKDIIFIVEGAAYKDKAEMLTNFGYKTA